MQHPTNLKVTEASQCQIYAEGPQFGNRGLLRIPGSGTAVKPYLERAHWPDRKERQPYAGLLTEKLESVQPGYKGRCLLFPREARIKVFCTVWKPYTQEAVRKLEMAAARYITNRYGNTSSVTSMLDHLQWESLESRRIKCQLTMLF